METLVAPPRAIIFDLGDVLFTWSAATKSTIPARQLRDILSTPIWYAYDRGEITRDVCYQLSAEIFSLTASEIAEAFAQARLSLQPDPSITSFLRELNENPTIKVYAMSNIGKEDFEDLETRPGMDWSLFDRVFTSAAAGMRKPEPEFYRYVLDQINVTSDQVAFIDDKEENIRAAQALGIRGYVFDESTVRVLREALESPIGRGWRYIYENANHCDSITNSGVAFTDNFAKLLIADTLKNERLIDLDWGSKTTWNFFSGETVLVPGGWFPDDLDTTSLALQVLRPSSSEMVSSILDQMAEYVNEDGTFQASHHDSMPIKTYYDHGRGHEFERTLQVVHSVLSDRSYIQGTRYYPSADCCLGFIGRLLRSSDDPHLQTTLGPLLKARMYERLGLGGSALDLAMRIITCTQMGIECQDDRQALLSVQCDDGSWEPGWMYQYGSTGVKIGNRGVTTAMAVAALSTGIKITLENGMSKTNGAPKAQSLKV
ncbi:Alpha-D-glucose-1-phosphate phosphatase YihX [Cytospora mali]|uniref:Alpha-D-glucose-1-phosphate phosphatase YihX n=1 Tax=Cytospora mali TaxID=578113 RepID=A0A194W929_CYTMA|nr:Alpha-D-glucose-1-phosphate phosphatase YihX [Valsa mali]